MKLMSEALEHRRLRAPTNDGGKLIEPPLSAVGELIERNRATAAEYDVDVQGKPLAQLAREARGELVEAAWQCTRAYRDIARPTFDAATRVFLAGHQPQLFHPGVWFKNFVLSKIGLEQRGIAINLVIDSDTIKTASLRVPSGTVSEPHVESVPFDRPTAEIPYEERTVVDRACLETFGGRAANTIRPLVPDTLLEEFWPRVAERARHATNLGECIAQARHQQEAAWGATTLEIPQSQVCGLPAFHWFTCHLLANLPRLWDEYNRSVGDYRRANHVRSSAHPVPDLAVEDGWLEAPFWIWDRENPRRRRLFARQRGDEIVLSDRQSLEVALALSPEGDATRASSQLAELAARGIKLRTRALITTLFARLFLGDLFLHGIGGAKYDQVTEALIERFFGVKSPRSMTLTATLRLPVPRERTTAEDGRRVDHQLRELAYHPERYLDEPSNDGASELAREKRRWIETEPSRETARERCHNIRDLNERMQPFVARRWQSLLGQRQVISNSLRAEAVLASREYAFCLYPADSLRRLMNAE